MLHFRSPSQSKGVFMNTIRYWVGVIRLLPCAVALIYACVKEGYYPWHHAIGAIVSYIHESLWLGAEVLKETEPGSRRTVGTVTCSTNIPGRHPVHEKFPQIMQDFRRAGIRLGYVEHPRVLPATENAKDVAQSLMDKAIAWGFRELVDELIIAVRPNEVRYFCKRGFKVAAIEVMAEFEDSKPSILLTLNTSELQMA